MKIHRLVLAVGCIILCSLNAAIAQVAPPVPQNLSASIIEEEGEKYVLLTWDKKAANDSLTTGYNVFVNFPPDTSMLLWGKAGMVFTNEYKFLLNSTYSQEYHFQVCAVRNFPEVVRSARGNKIKVVTPSKKLPFINFNEVKVDGKKVTLSWQYNHNIVDHVGYRIYRDGELFADEKKLKKDTYDLSFTIEEAGKYTFEITAVTASGLESDKSQKRFVRIEK